MIWYNIYIDDCQYFACSRGSGVTIRRHIFNEKWKKSFFIIIKYDKTREFKEWDNGMILFISALCNI